MLKLGEKIIKDIYLGDKKIAKAFLGDKLVFQAGKPIFLEYIQTDGNSYIDTEYCANGNTVIEYTWETTQKPTSTAGGLLGSRVSTDKEEYLVFQYSNLNLRLDFGRYSEPIPMYSISLNTKYTMKAGTGEIYINGELVKSYVPKTGQTKNSMYLGNFNNNGTPYTTGTAQKIYGFKAYENNVLLHDFRPCIAPNGQVAMYDEVNKKYFYNQGTGNFTAGNKINFVDYITFDGASWVDTGIAYQDCTVEFGLTSPVIADRQLMGWSASASTYWGIVDGKFELGATVVLAESDTTQYSEAQITVAETDLRYLTLSHAGKSIVRQGNKEASVFNYIIGAVPTTYAYAFVGNIYYHRFKNTDGVIIQDLRPCVVGGEACFYDMVTGKIFTNAGTGTLTYTE